MPHSRLGAADCRNSRDPRIDQLGGTINPIATSPAPPLQASDAAEQDAFTLVAEIADMAREHAELLADAALRADRARVRLHACLISRVIRSALLTVADLEAAAERNWETEAAP